jgi:hypothetical protein
LSISIKYKDVDNDECNNNVDKNHDDHHRDYHDDDRDDGYGIGVDYDVAGGGGGGGGGEGVDGGDYEGDIATKTRSSRVMMLTAIQSRLPCPQNLKGDNVGANTVLSCSLDDKGWNFCVGEGGEEGLSLSMFQAM